MNVYFYMVNNDKIKIFITKTYVKYNLMHKLNFNFRINNLKGDINTIFNY